MPPLQLNFEDMEPDDEGLPPDFTDGLPPVPPGKLLSTAQDELRKDRWTKNGARCGCCGRRNKVDPRGITRDIVLALLHIYGECGKQPFYKPTVLHGVGSSSRYETIMKHHGVLVQCPPPDGTRGRKNAWWRLTDKGVAWIEGRIRLPRTIQLTPGDHFMGYVDEADTVSVEDVLGEPFDLAAFLASMPVRPAS